MESESVKNAVKEVNSQVKKAKKIFKPYLPLITRVLIVATFVEDGIRCFYEFGGQVDFLKHQYGIPKAICGILIVITTIMSLLGAALILTQKPQLEKFGCYALISFVLYQQAMYGRHSPIGSGNFGFLMRNLCLAGTLLMLLVQGRMSQGHTALPGIPDPGDKTTTVTYIQLAARALIVLLSLEFLSTLGPIGTLTTIPVLLAVLAGYKSQISGSLLLLIYFLHNVINSAFWSVRTDSYRGEFDREVKRYEFVQTISIMGGLLLLVASGPGALSLDEKFDRRKNF
uniref:Surfeit locus protein 4 n=1 Tax=Erythrolobus madagascarensis TaxID=708628 RepID=A0A7S0XID0_9RHOD|mmetsp:Transcript_3454/g.7480  ORF Transcript_3454/g.7480 Transcript_3454/m.7480 type:complete len:285 (+) Transcript_3454:165-1019(+)|eukprot:CAMPEP_0185845706 /NCGR_PEP_ID=MMETSP1354-20130828/1595_1 /TAXON_ID=708628 /ORGANISM="Erythrolobus madagascarensis, Strain CCMP3276" /LENGTH=284 /DNA_ID=CAMNT_0028545729 /DNA_START=161 /DNA_END=1015 /DNA_ORIENTATION=-